MSATSFAESSALKVGAAIASATVSVQTQEVPIRIGPLTISEWSAALAALLVLWQFLISIPKAMDAWDDYKARRLSRKGLNGRRKTDRLE